MFNDTFRTLATPSTGLYKDKGSKFMAFAYPVQSLDEVKEHIDSLKKEYFDARHHCYAYILGANKEVFRQNDDGEPSGTGGKPIYGQLLSANLTNTLIVVVRYFGGILLGTSGLITAYKSASLDAINNATIIECTIDNHYRLLFEYPDMNSVMRLLKDYDLRPCNQSFDLQCSLEVLVRQSLSVRFYDDVVKLRSVKIDVLP